MVEPPVVQCRKEFGDCTLLGATLALISFRSSVRVHSNEFVAQAIQCPTCPIGAKNDFFGRSDSMLRDGGRICECFSRSSLVGHANWLIGAVIYSTNLPTAATDRQGYRVQ